MRRGTPTRSGSGCARWCRSGRGVLILDGTSFPKQGAGLGRRRPAVLRRARQDRELPDRGHGRAVDRRAGVAAGRDAVSARGRGSRRASGAAGKIPDTVTFAPKWQLALTLLRQVRAAGFTVTAVVGDAEFGDNATLRRTLHRAQAALCVGGLVRSQGVPGDAGPRGAAAADGQRAPAHPSPVAARARTTVEARAWAATQPPRPGDSSRGATGRTPPGAPASVPSGSRPRTTGARPDGSPPKSGCSANGNWPAATASATTWWICRPPRSLRALVQLAHQRWAIEQQYQELKDEIGLDHFEGRSLPGWQRHVVLDGDRLQLSPERTSPTRADAPHVAAGARRHSRGADRAFLHDAARATSKWMLKLKDVELRI